MSLPTIVVTGAAGNLLLITDHKGIKHRIPKASVCDVFDSSNDNVIRLDISHARGELNLQFETQVQLDAVLVIIDGAY